VVKALGKEAAKDTLAYAALKQIASYTKSTMVFWISNRKNVLLSVNYL